MDLLKPCVSQNATRTEMLSKPLRNVRVAATTGFALAVLAATLAFAAVRDADPPKVEYVVVEGRECLQPKVSDASANLADYRSAESRWLASKYPGVIAPIAQTMILLSPADGSGGRSKVTTKATPFTSTESLDRLLRSVSTSM